ncbi:MAG: OFA family MFS transporter [Clostridia bacterium]|nr:OFA family MFS transporter [Clostridia bacterium]
MKNDIAEVKTMNRWIPVIAGIAIQLCLGTAYIWGVFQPEVVKTLAWSQKNAALTFSLLLVVLSFGSIVGGLIQGRFSSGFVILGGGLILGLGFFLASFATPANPWIMWITYGIIGGFGMGTTYTTTIAVCQKWFPDKRGLVTGIIVSALGFGGLVFTFVAKYLIATRGVMETFSWFAVIFVIVTFIGSFFIKNPPVDYKPKGWVPPVKSTNSTVSAQNFTPTQMLKTPQFYLVTVALMTASAAGLMVIPFAKILGISGGLTDAVATSGVMVISVFNSCGRLFWGWVSDKLGRKNTLVGLMLIAGTSILFVAAAKSYMILVLIGIVGFSYGGFLGVFPSLTADYWGIKNMAVNYGLVLLGFGVGAVASSYIAGYFKDLTGGFTIPFIVASVAAFIGAGLMFLLKPPKLKQG